jgi:hypothetical protein
MATPPNPPPGPARNQQQQNTVDNATAQLAADLRAAIESLSKGSPAIKDLNAVVERLHAALRATGDDMRDISKKAKDWSSELRHTLAFADNVEESFKAITDYQKKLVKEGLKAKDYKEVQHVLEEIEKSSKAMVDKGVMSDDHARLFKRHTQEVKKALVDIKGKMGGAFDAKHVEATLTPLIRMTKLVAKLSTDMKGLSFSHLNKSIATAETALGKMMGRNWSRVEKFQKYAQTGHEIKVAHQQKRSLHVEQFKARRDEITSAVKGMGIDVSKYRTPKRGKLRETVFNKDREKIEEAHYKSALDANMGKRSARIYAKNAVAEIAGERPNVGMRLGMGLLQHGEGSMGRGLLARGAGLLEGGAGTAMRMTAEFAPILAVLDIVKDGFDKNVKMNSEVSEKLGAGNIFGGQNDAITSLRNTRRNLNGPLYSRLGIGYEKNLDLAKGMVDNGLSTHNLSAGIMERDKNGFAKSSFGMIQRNAYAFGKLAGLDPAQTTAQTIKLVTQYGQSLKGTEDFFVTINKDAMAAGISASKYIDMLDEVNNHYDRSNKLIQQTVDTMRLLARTGRETSDSIKDAMDIATNGGQQQPLETSAFLKMQTLSDPEMQTRLVQSRRMNFESMLDNLSSAMGPQYDKDTLRKGFASGGLGYVSQLKSDADKRFEGDSLAHQGANAAINNTSRAYERMNVTNDTSGRGRDGGLGLAVSDQMLGSDRTSESMDTLQALLSALKMAGSSTKDFMTEKGRAGLDQNLTFLKAQEFYHLDPTKMNRVGQYVDDAAKGRLDMAKAGLSDHDRANPNDSDVKDRVRMLDSTYEFLKQNNVVGLGNSGDRSADLKAFANTKDGAATMTRLLPQMQGVVEDVFNSPTMQKYFQAHVTETEKNAKLEDAAKLVATTRPTAEIFASAFTSLFNSISAPLDLISRILAHKFSADASATNITEDQKKQIEGLDNSGQLPAALDTWSKHIDHLQDQSDGAKTDAERKKIDAQIGAAKNRLGNAQSSLDTFHSGSGIGTDQASDIVGLVTDAAQLPEAPSGLSSSVASQANDVNSFFKSKGIKFNDHNFADLDSNTASSIQTRLDQMVKLGQIKMTQEADDNGRVHTYITNNYNSVDMAQSSFDTQSAVNNSGESAPSQAKPGGGK